MKYNNNLYKILFRLLVIFPMSKRKGVELEDLPSNYDPEPFFSLLDLFFERDKRVLVKHHIDSFNQFIEEIIPSVLQSSENIISEKITENKVIRYRLTFEDLGIKPPMMDNDEDLMFPLDAIQKNLTYSSKYTATVTQWQDIVDINTGETETKMIGEPDKDVPIAKIPIMVGSNYCNLVLSPNLASKHCRFDAGGYFIVNGSEKVVLSVESIIQRKPLVFTKKDQSTLIYYVQVQSRPVTQFVGNTQVFTIRIKKDNSVVLSIPAFKEVSIFVLMRALGLETDEDIVDAILDVKKEKAMLNQLSISMNAAGTSAITQEEAMEILINNMRSTKTYTETDPILKSQQKKKHLMKILTQFILPHVVSGSNNPKIDMIYKAYYIGYMINKLLKCYLRDQKVVEEARGCDDRDSMINKRIELTGGLLGMLFDQYFKKMLNDTNKIFKSKNVDDTKPPHIVTHIKSNTIEQGLRQALLTGVFGNQNRKGLSQVLNRMNHQHSSSYMRRIITPTVDASTNKMTSPRHLHNTQYGSMCPLETPEGPKTGIVKNLALISGITISLNSQIPIISDYLADKVIPLESVNRKKLHQYVKVFLNGSWLGVTQEIIRIYRELRQKRFQGEIEKTVSLVLNYELSEFHIYTEGGRLIRPYLTVTNNKLNFKAEMLNNVSSWDEFLAKYPDVIEFLDKEEEMNMMLASFPQYIEKQYQLMKRKPVTDREELDKINRTNRYDDNVFLRYTHCEIHPCTILGIISSNIPFPNHNQSPRGIFQYNQARHAMGLYISDYRERTDISYILYHPQIPIVVSRASKYTGTHIFPAGENAIVAIASYTGFNQEDSLLMNDSAIQKGMFRAQALKKYAETIKKNPASSQTGIFMKPDRNKVDNMKDANYETLTEEGYAKVETVIKDGDVIIGMVNPKPTTKENKKPYKDNSTIYKSLVPGAIDKVITGLNNDGYPIIKIRVRSERIPNIGDKFSCYDEQTEILTDQGWVFFRDLTENSKVASLVDGKKLVYEEPLAIQRYDYQGKMYRIRTERVDLSVTPNHRMWVSPISTMRNTRKYRLERADEIVGKRYYYQKNAVEYGADAVKFFNLPMDSGQRKVDMQVWLTFFGIWVANGSVSGDRLVTFELHKSSVKKKLTLLCEMMGIKGRSPSLCDMNFLDHKDTWNIDDKQLASFLKSSIIAGADRYLPDWVWQLTKKQCRWLIDGMFLHSSHWLKRRSTQCTTLSKRLANDLQRLCLHAGLSADLVVEQTIEEIIYIVNINDERESCPLIDHREEWVDYHGPVYCCTVSSGVIYVRRNGLPVFSGNSRAGQKGTIGLKPHRSDMPFAEDGLIPDIIINPNAMPKRMTIGQLVECLLSKVCAIKGVYGDATPFTGVDLHKINEELVAAGYEEWGNQVMYNGMTGEKMTTKIFIGPTYYQRLKQMVGDKAHSRARGPTQLLTRQAPEGRSREGGLRIGEMERDVLCAHAMAQTLKEKTVDNSDIYSIYVCDICGLFASRVPGKKYYTCHSCQNTTRISKIIIPYAFKLFLQELRSINILGRIRTSKTIITPKG